MKWFFGFNEESEWFDNYFRYIKCAVNSCTKNTDLEPHFLYDGKPNELTSWLESQKVSIHYIRSRFYDFFQELSSKGLNAKVASGAFLRAEIPSLVHSTDSFILYTDCDVMFLGSTNKLKKLRPKNFACAPEFNKDNWSYFNSGVMLMNTESMYSKMGVLEKTVLASSAYDLNQSYDQPVYNKVYKNQWGVLPIEFNWKPYWGKNTDVNIVHFHGVKVENIERILKGQRVQGIQQQLFDKSPEGYKYYYNLAEEFENGS